MPRVHKDYREGRCSRFTNESKFWGKSNTSQMAEEAIREGDKLRKMISGHRILLDVSRDKSLAESIPQSSKSRAAANRINQAQQL